MVRKGYYSFQFTGWGKWSEERLSNLPKDTQLEGAGNVQPDYKSRGNCIHLLGLWWGSNKLIKCLELCLFESSMKLIHSNLHVLSNLSPYT